MQSPRNSRNNGGQRRQHKPVVLITGGAGNIGTALIEAMQERYAVISLDRVDQPGADESYIFDLTSPDSIELALRKMADDFGPKVASVIHLAAYFDFTGEESPLYQAVNVEGTRNLLRALQSLQVEQFVYSGTMLVHRPGEPGVPTTERTPVEPKWAYPKSKARTEEVIAEEHGDIPFVLLHLAGLYNKTTAVPTLSQQIARIYERAPKAHAYSGSLDTGQAFVHQDDMVDAFVRTLDRRGELPTDTTILIGEEEAVSYGELQSLIGKEIHGEEEWDTFVVPKPVASAGAWLQEKSEPLVPDDFDAGEKPFIRPFMIDMADDHYELDTSRARTLLGWSASHTIRDGIRTLVESLKNDPVGWYEANGITPPAWLTAAQEKRENPEEVRARAEEEFRKAHRQFRWAGFLNMAAGTWLMTSPPVLGYESTWMVWSDVLSGALITVLSFLTLSWRLSLLRWAVALCGIWVMFAPLVFWAPTAAAYHNGTIIGMLVFALAALARPAPGVSMIAATTGPTVPPGWDFTPSSWFQRMPIIVLAFVGLYVSRYLTAYQLGHIDSVWDPFFAGSLQNPKNGTEEIITSSVSKAWPVPDAGIGALTYMLEILTGIIGSSRRWRTMPWLVVLFGIMIVPLGVVSITFIVIQPIVIGTWCTLCLIAAAAMVIQIPYSIDELVATGQFLVRRKRAGRPVLLIFFTGDTDEGDDRTPADDFSMPPGAMVRDMLGGGVNVPWTLAASVAIGIWLMFTRLTLGSDGFLADADHFIGALVITVAVTAMAEIARPLRFLNALFGMALAMIPFVAGANLLQSVSGVVCGLALIALSIPRGKVNHRYGKWNRLLV